jgi:hypothetical protein
MVHCPVVLSPGHFGLVSQNSPLAQSLFVEHFFSSFAFAAAATKQTRTASAAVVYREQKSDRFICISSISSVFPGESSP